jgi:hypothetical protein
VGVVAISTVTPVDVSAAKAELHALRRLLRPGTALFAGGAGVLSLAPLDDGITIVRDLDDWRAMLRVHGPAA